ncbi:MAG: outer membrane protein assembly factor BamE [Amylibacter sp.]|nr:outer membrane protein assembly factor BamE [Amylibacter sp.]
MSSFSAKTKKTLAVTACIIVLAGCSSTYKFHGYAPSEDEMANVIIGADTRETVEEIIGKPSSSGVLEDGNWYYVATKMEQRTYKAPKAVSRELVAVSFDEDGVVSNVERFGLEDGRVVTFSRRVTDLPVKGPSAISQMLGNIGNFDLGQAVGAQ